MIKKNSDSEVFDIFVKNYQRYLNKRAAPTPTKALSHLLAAVEDPTFFKSLFTKGEVIDEVPFFRKPDELAALTPGQKKLQ